MIVTAKFIGKDGSLGYVKNRKYNLNVTITDGNFGLSRLRIETLNREELPCEYNSFKTFLNNWEVIE